ncbi:probable 18S rRNA (guanine-N(7))-methyltransferase isoform X1 [Anser cygnoides]
MSERAVELLGLPEDRPCLLLDVGCGSGLSGDFISEEGHYWIGMDISPAMLDVAVEREVEGDLLLADVGHGIPFRPGMFDGCISISAVQWLCNADKKSHSPPKRLYQFFSTLYTALAQGSRAVLQLYPENSEQVQDTTWWGRGTGRARQKTCVLFEALNAWYCPTSAGAHHGPSHESWLYWGNGGRLPQQRQSQEVLPLPLCWGFWHVTKGEELRLAAEMPSWLLGYVEELWGLGTECADGEEIHQAKFTSVRTRFRNTKGKSVKKSRDWILEKKERRRRQGKEVRADTKYTGRKRRPHF